MVDSLLESQGKILAWDGKKPLYQADFDIKWKNTSTDELLKLHKNIKGSLEPGGAKSGFRSQIFLTKRMPQKLSTGIRQVSTQNISFYHSAFHSAKALETELANRKIDFKPIELEISTQKKVGKFKTKTNVIKTLLSNVKKLGPALKGTGKILPIVGPLLQIREMKKQYEGLMEPKEPTIY